MKKILMAAVVGMMIFQSCTKENIDPQSAVDAKRTTQPQPVTSKSITRSEPKYIRCGTVVPQPTAQPRGTETPPIFIPKQPLAIN